MISHELTLRYSLHPGWLTPYVEALLIGQAMGRRCSSCGSISFPPRRYCRCGSGAAEWLKISGSAVIVLRTHGSDGTFGLVQFDGAANKAITRLEDFPPDLSEGQLIAPPDEVPALILSPSQSRSTQ